MYEFSISANPQQKLFSKSAKTSHFSKPPLLPTPPKPTETSKPKTQTTRNINKKSYICLYEWKKMKGVVLFMWWALYTRAQFDT